MTVSSIPGRRLALAVAVVAALGFGTIADARSPNSYVVRVLVSDGNLQAEHVDPDLVNPWGIAFNPTGFSWVSDNHTGKSTLYDGNGVKQSLVVAIPGAHDDAGSPDGILYNASSDFKVTENGLAGTAVFIFSSEDGVISGWAPSVDTANAITAYKSPNGVYKGIAMASTSSGNRLYATDFHNAHVDVFDASYNLISVPGDFVDPVLPPKFAPFGIANIGGLIYVTFTKQDADAHDDVPGRGVVDIFDTDGNLLRRGAAQAGLSSPWGVTLAPADFGHFSNRLLVSNFGSGQISAYDPKTGDFLGYVRNTDGTKFKVPGLWGIEFGNDAANQPHNALFWSAGPAHENHGAYGRLDTE
ncbi:MAG TPA: TIGR03118 family protein [Burkholderiaceae bacterium]|jgi:uncharacterized protein (TIGR03118 family)|nr:TIGR03118 family protein [Burkholderiaceae bacterium]